MFFTITPDVSAIRKKMHSDSGAIRDMVSELFGYTPR